MLQPVATLCGSIDSTWCCQPVQNASQHLLLMAAAGGQWKSTHLQVLTRASVETLQLPLHTFPHHVNATGKVWDSYDASPARQGKTAEGVGRPSSSNCATSVFNVHRPHRFNRTEQPFARTWAQPDRSVECSNAAPASHCFRRNARIVSAAVPAAPNTLAAVAPAVHRPIDSDQYPAGLPPQRRSKRRCPGKSKLWVARRGVPGHSERSVEPSHERDVIGGACRDDHHLCPAASAALAAVAARLQRQWLCWRPGARVEREAGHDGPSPPPHPGPTHYHQPHLARQRHWLHAAANASGAVGGAAPAGGCRPAATT
eukprot:350428-Chlamydomonas_euryale.AAC.2